MGYIASDELLRKRLARRRLNDFCLSIGVGARRDGDGAAAEGCRCLAEAFVVAQGKGLAWTDGPVDVLHGGEQFCVGDTRGFEAKVQLQFTDRQVGSFSILAINVAVVKPKKRQLTLQFGDIVTAKRWTLNRVCKLAGTKLELGLRQSSFSLGAGDAVDY